MNIKTIILVISISIISINLSFAQTDSTMVNTKSVESENYIPKSEFRKFRMGIYGGMGWSWMKPKTKDYSKDGSHFAYSYGLITDYNFTDNYTLSTGFAISNTGGKLSYSDAQEISNGVKDTGMVNRKYSISYFEIPILVKMKTNQMGYFTYFAQLGIRNYMRLGSTYDETFAYSDNGNTKTISSEEIENSDGINFYRMAFSFGIGTEYAISKSFSSFGYLSYDNGLTIVLNNTNSVSELKENAVIKQFTLTVGFLF
ncbi:MAG: hypothetical protein DRI86_07620 [Bacteroidetes bacterium]|nr:MAG: hypothetical protein DRI86_07620 [Bacteroidota bacterium]